MITEPNLTLNFQEIHRTLELQTQLYSFIQTGIKLSSINFLENVQIGQISMIFAFKIMENSISMKIYSQSHENSNRSWEYYRKSMKTEQNNFKVRITLKHLWKQLTNKTQRTLVLHQCMRNVLKQWSIYMRWQDLNHTWSKEF